MKVIIYILAVSCSAETLSNGIVITDGLTYGEKVYYSCDRCFYLKNGDSSRWCGADGLWVGTKPSCMSMYCCYFRNYSTNADSTNADMFVILKNYDWKLL